MSKRFDLLVFDWDGTLMDSAACIAASLRAACEELGLAVPSERSARYVIGLGLADAMAHILPELPATHYPRVVECYRRHFLARNSGTRLYSDAESLIRELHATGYLLAVATGKSRRGLDRALDDTGLGRYFHASRCADECRSKPHPDMLHELMVRLGVPPGRTLMIGDTTHDLVMAHSAGVACVGMAHGAHEACDLESCEPLACLADCRALRQWLASHG